MKTEFAAKGRRRSSSPLIQRNGEARSQVMPDVKAKTLKGIIRRNVEGTAKIRRMRNPSYFGLGKEFSSHDKVNLHVNFSESFFSLLKRSPSAPSTASAPSTLEEFDFRWNRRKTTDNERMLKYIAGTEGTRLYFKATPEDLALL